MWDEGDMIGIVNGENSNLCLGAKEKIRTLKPKSVFCFPFLYFIYRNKHARRGEM